MSGWSIVAIIAIIVWGLVQMSKALNRSLHGVASDERDREGYGTARDVDTDKEIDDLRERIKVLERIATDGNSLDARETKRIAAEIEALRDKQAD